MLIQPLARRLQPSLELRLHHFQLLPVSVHLVCLCVFVCRVMGNLLRSDWTRTPLLPLLPPPPSLSSGKVRVFAALASQHSPCLGRRLASTFFGKKRKIERDGRLPRCRLELMSRLLRAPDPRR